LLVSRWAQILRVVSRAMSVKTSIRQTKNGEVRYLQLAHNEWDAADRRRGLETRLAARHAAISARQARDQCSRRGELRGTQVLAKIDLR
jgi:hypothetical protein